MNTKCILEFIYYPDNFPEIYSYYLMDINDINKFKYYYKELKFNPIKNFLNNNDLTIENTCYNVFENNNSEFFITIEKFILLTKSCDLLLKFYELIDKQLNKSNVSISDDIICIDNSKSSNDSLLENTECVVNIINLFNNDKENNKDKINAIINNNPELINDTEINEINDIINNNSE